MLVATDMAEQGLSLAATKEEIAAFIKSNSTLGGSGIRKMFGNPTLNGQKCSEIYIALHLHILNYIEQNQTSDPEGVKMLLELGLNLPHMLEHALCKVSKCWKELGLALLDCPLYNIDALKDFESSFHYII